MAKVLKDIERILLLARKAHDHLQKNNVRGAQLKLRRIIRLDLDELSRLHKDQGDEKLLEECSVVLKDAKKALKLLRFENKPKEAENLIDEIIRLEGLEFSQLEEREKYLNRAYLYWRDVVRSKKIYHGTSNLSVPQIEKYGLTPNMRPPFWKEFQRLYQLYKKAGEHNPLGLVHFDFEQGTKGMVSNGIFATQCYGNAKRYARKSPAIWHERVGKRDHYHALKHFLLKAFLHGDYWGVKKGILDQMYDLSPKKCYENIIEGFSTHWNLSKNEICPLSKEEFLEIKRIFEKLWVQFRNQKPAVIHLSVLAPAVANGAHFINEKTKKSFIYNFKTFLEVLEDYRHSAGNEDPIAHFEKLVFGPGGYQIIIWKRVPQKFIEIEFI